MKEYFDVSSILVILVTFILFVMALFTKGFTHDLLLEAGVFLVSVKLILMAYNNRVISKKIIEELDEIKTGCVHDVHMEKEGDEYSTD